MTEWDQDVAGGVDLRQAIVKLYHRMNQPDGESSKLMVFDAAPVIQAMQETHQLEEATSYIPIATLIDCCGDVDVAYTVVDSVIQDEDVQEQLDFNEPHAQAAFDGVYDFTTRMQEWIVKDVSKFIPDAYRRIKSCIPMTGQRIGVIYDD